jgi:hypothetical protein
METLQGIDKYVNRLDEVRYAAAFLFGGNPRIRKRQDRRSNTPYDSNSYQLSIINYQLSTINYQLTLRFVVGFEIE